MCKKNKRNYPVDFVVVVIPCLHCSIIQWIVLLRIVVDCGLLCCGGVVPLHCALVVTEQVILITTLPCDATLRALFDYPVDCVIADCCGLRIVVL